MTLTDVILVMFAAWLFTLAAMLIGVRVGRERYLVLPGTDTTKTEVITTPLKVKEKKPFPQVVEFKRPWERTEEKEDAGSRSKTSD